MKCDAASLVEFFITNNSLFLTLYLSKIQEETFPSSFFTASHDAYSFPVNILTAMGWSNSVPFLLISDCIKIFFVYWFSTYLERNFLNCPKSELDMNSYERKV